MIGVETRRSKVLKGFVKKWMSRVILLEVVLCLVVLGTVYGATEKQKVGPKIVLSETTYDVGEVREGKALVHSFKVQNAGDEVLKIIKVKPG